jgi:hypothetical protein
MSADYRVKFRTSDSFAELWYECAPWLTADDVTRFAKTAKPGVLLPYVQRAVDATGTTVIKTKASLVLRRELRRAQHQIQRHVDRPITPTVVFRAAVYALAAERSAPVSGVEGAPARRVQIMGAIPLIRIIRADARESDQDVARRIAASLRIVVGNSTFDLLSDPPRPSIPTPIEPRDPAP